MILENNYNALTREQIYDITTRKTIVSNNGFRDVAISGIPRFTSPETPDYVNWWKEQHKRCINGLWVGGRWIPGRLYYHANFFNIERNTAASKSRKTLALPDIRDTDWEIFTNLEICKGLCGFTDNGIPIYDENNVKGFLLIGPRDFGKSVIAASNIAYEYTFFKNNHVLVSAYETKYTQPILAKVRIGLDSTVGDIEFQDEFYPSPFTHARLSSDWSESAKIVVESGRKVRRQGNESVKGYRSVIHHRVFTNSPMAANGLRVGFHVFEEIGAFGNLIDSYNASVPCWRDGPNQFGVPYLVGTGGDMEKGSVNAQKMFYEPETYNLLKFHNDYDKDGSVISCFIPADMTQYKNAEGVTTPELRIKAKEFLLKRRESKRKADKGTYENELMYYPLEPKEAFLTTNGNIFPRQQLEDQLNYLLATKASKNMGMKVQLIESNGKIISKLAPDLFEVDFPHTNKTAAEGCVVIYEYPMLSDLGDIPHNMYIAGIDPIDQDEVTESPSLGSIFIYKRFISFDRTYDMLVAEYTGRPEKATIFYETCRKLLMLYNAKALYENMIKGLKQYFEMKSCLYLLKEQPSTLIKDIIPSSKVERGYGVHMNKEIKNFVLRSIRDWLLTEYEPGKFNVRKIYCINLLKELLAYNDKGNFDRVIAFGLCLLHNQALHKIKVLDSEEDKASIDKDFKKLFSSDGW